MSNVLTPPSILEILQKATEYLARKGIDTARLDAELLLGHVLGLERIQLYVKFDQPLQSIELDRYRVAIARRGKRMPVAYIIGSKEFYSLELAVNPNVLIPRPETELLVDWVLDYLGSNGGRKRTNIVELGTGTGAIAVSVGYTALHKGQEGLRIFATDISREALQIAQANVDKWQVGEVVQLYQGDLLQPLPRELAFQVDLVVSNPPYIASEEIRGLAPEIREYEPLGALDGGPDGLAFYRRIYDESRDFLVPGGHVVLEIGHGQGQHVMDLARQYGYTDIELHHDYSDKERMVTVKWR